MPCGIFVVANCFDSRFLELLTQSLFTREAPDASAAFIDVVDVWEARLPTYNNDALVQIINMNM